MAPLRATPEHGEACNDEYVGGAVKDAIAKGFELKVFDADERIPAAQHVVPLQQLVEHDAIKEAAKAQARKEFPLPWGNASEQAPRDHLLLFEQNAASALNGFLHGLAELVQ
jgi:hypothetical protein